MLEKKIFKELNQLLRGELMRYSKEINLTYFDADLFNILKTMSGELKRL